MTCTFLHLFALLLCAAGFAVDRAHSRDPPHVQFRGIRYDDGVTLSLGDPTYTADVTTYADDDDETDDAYDETWDPADEEEGEGEDDDDEEDDAYDETWDPADEDEDDEDVLAMSPDNHLTRTPAPSLQAESRFALHLSESRPSFSTPYRPRAGSASGRSTLTFAEDANTRRLRPHSLLQRRGPDTYAADSPRPLSRSTPSSPSSSSSSRFSFSPTFRSTTSKSKKRSDSRTEEARTPSPQRLRRSPEVHNHDASKTSLVSFRAKKRSESAPSTPTRSTMKGGKEEEEEEEGLYDIHRQHSDPHHRTTRSPKSHKRHRHPAAVMRRESSRFSFSGSSSRGASHKKKKDRDDSERQRTPSPERMRSRRMRRFPSVAVIGPRTSPQLSSSSGDGAKSGGSPRSKAPGSPKQSPQPKQFVARGLYSDMCLEKSLHPVERKRDTYTAAFSGSAEAKVAGRGLSGTTFECTSPSKCIPIRCEPPKMSILPRRPSLYAFTQNDDLDSFHSAWPQRHGGPVMDVIHQYGEASDITSPELCRALSKFGWFGDAEDVPMYCYDSRAKHRLCPCSVYSVIPGSGTAEIVR